MVLCLGPPRSGKTLLLRKLQCSTAVDATSSSVPTTGTDLCLIQLPGGNEIKVREVGGDMSPLWNRYYEGVERVIYVVDTSDLCRISAAGVLLYGMLADPKLRNTKFLLVLTKMDMSYRQMRNEALLMLQIERLKKEIPQELTIVEASAISGEGREEILSWLAGKKKQ